MLYSLLGVLDGFTQLTLLVKTFSIEKFHVLTIDHGKFEAIHHSISGVLPFGSPVVLNLVLDI